MRSICVFCGSNSGANAAYRNAAVQMGQEIARRNLQLVYGGAAIGLMGALADAAIAAGARVRGVIPHSLEKLEIAHPKLDELHAVNSMHERKAMMADLSDGFIALPGGAGTLDELFEIWTWGQLGHHAKPIGLLNVSGYFDGLLEFLDHQVAERFIRPAHRSMLIVETDPERLLAAFEKYIPPHVTKWIEAEQR